MTTALRVVASPAESGPDDNPYVNLLYEGMGDAVVVTGWSSRALLLQPVDVVHVHWPEFLVSHRRWVKSLGRCGVVLLLLYLARRRGAILVWTGHNLRPHHVRHPRLTRVFFRLFSRQVDVLLTLTEAARAQLIEEYPALVGTPAEFTRHGHYREAYPPPPARAAARAELALAPDATVLLALGKVRRYKQLPRLLASPTPTSNVLLVIAGAAGDLRDEFEVREAADGNAGARLDLRRLSDHDVALWLGASDVVVLAYDTSSSLTSGAALLALSFDVPVVLSRSATSEELQREVGPEWVYLVDDVSEAVDAALDLLRSTRGQRALPAAYDWSAVAAATLRAYRKGRGRA